MKGDAIDEKIEVRLAALDFFAGSGLVRLGLAPFFETVWANDCCPRKAAVYLANFPPSRFHLGDVSQVAGTSLPDAKVAWASFPCQDLSLAGAKSGLEHAGRAVAFLPHAFPREYESIANLNTLSGRTSSIPLGAP